ncbi:hypothetical protein UlMin_043917 [Ulmus minor]
MSLDDDDDWGLTEEQLDSLEREAINQIAQRRLQPTTTTFPSSSSDQPQPHHFSTSNKVDTLTSGTRVLPASVPCRPNTEDEPPNELLKVSVKFFLHSTGNIAAKCVFNQAVVDALRQIPKATWNAKERLWVFPPSSLETAEKLLNEISRVNVLLENLDPLVRRAMTVASAAPDLRDQYDKMPATLESKLLPFQREGVRFILQHRSRALLADEMGLGKTLQAIAVASCFPESWPVLVIAPSSLRVQWASMIQQWLDIPSSDILVVLPQCGGSNKSGFTIVSSNTKGAIRLDGVFNIISYDVVPKLKDLLMASEFKVVIADESHYLKNPQAKRTICSLPVIQKAQYAILLSGTPALSRPIELFKQLEALCPDVYRSVHEYGGRYCKGGVFGMYQGASNHEELYNLMKATVMIRRLKKDVLSELPVKRRQQVFLDLDQKDMRQVSSLLRELEVLKRKIDACMSKEEADSMKFTEKNLISKVYQETAVAKTRAVLDYLDTVIEAGCKFLVFAWHQPLIDSIHNFLIKKKVGCIRIDGGTPPLTRQALVTDFQEKDSVRVAVLSIKAAGVGLTLTAASTVIFAELSWTPGDLVQAEDRAHRIGQASSVNIYYLFANDTGDDLIWNVIHRKMENVGQVLDGHENTLEVENSQPKRSPAKHKVGTSQPGGTPTKQKTLDSYVKRCNTDDRENQSKLKYPRH